ncbi:MAG TPA: exodeoxyribonuclease VII small subunit [Desulfoprunum sp.]|nr:exodeoxyribonuclease VII small subunit [Desulfoprunum sp.]
MAPAAFGGAGANETRETKETNEALQVRQDVEYTGLVRPPVVLAGKKRRFNDLLHNPSPSDMAQKTFEAAMARLEQLTEELESGDISLDKSLKKFDEGVKLAEFCNAQLTVARARVEMLLEKDGRLQSVPFEGLDRGDTDLSE